MAAAEDINALVGNFICSHYRYPIVLPIPIPVGLHLHKRIYTYVSKCVCVHVCVISANDIRYRSIIVHLSADSGVDVVRCVHLSIRLMPASSSLSAAVSAAASAAGGISRPKVAVAASSPSTVSACQGVWPPSPDIPGGDRNRPAGLL